MNKFATPSKLSNLMANRPCMMMGIGLAVVTFFGIIIGVTEGEIIAPSTSLREYTDLETKLAMDYEVWQATEIHLDRNYGGRLLQEAN